MYEGRKCYCSNFVQDMTAFKSQSYPNKLQNAAINVLNSKRRNFTLQSL